MLCLQRRVYGPGGSLLETHSPWFMTTSSWVTHLAELRELGYEITRPMPGVWRVVPKRRRHDSVTYVWTIVGDGRR